MANDAQCLPRTAEGARVERWDYPKAGELYWNRFTHQIERADRDLESKFLVIVEK